MRVSGTYFERLIFGMFPFILIGGLIFYFFKKTEIPIIIAAMLIMSGILFLIDKLPLRKTQFSKFNITNNELFIDGHLLNTELIDIIKPFKTSPPHSLLAFAVHLKDKTQLNFMDRPKTVFYKSKNKLGSKSLEILFTTFPTLKGKLMEVQY